MKRQMNAINITSQLPSLLKPWSPNVLAQFDGHDIMVGLGQKDYPWHTHTDFDDVFLVIQGHLTLEMRFAEGIQCVELNAGELFVVPRNVEHRPVAKGDVYFLLIEPTAS